MKIKILAACSIAIGLSFAAHAQTSLPFLQSKAALRSYAVDQAATASLYLFSTSEINDQAAAYTFSIPSNHTSADILKVYSNQTFSVTVLNPKDWITVESSVNNGDGYQLFFGYSSALPVLGKGGYSLPTVPMTLVLASQVPVKFSKQVEGAEMLYVDPVSGQTYNQAQLATFGDYVWFNSDSAGDGFLHVYFSDGTQSYFDLKNAGAKTSGTALSQTISTATIDNLATYTDPWTNGVSDTLQSSGNVGLNRTYELVMSSKGYVRMQIGTTEGAYAIGYWYRPAGNNSQTWQRVACDGPNGIANIPITGSGTWYVIPDWYAPAFHEPAPYIYNGDGGKG